MTQSPKMAPSTEQGHQNARERKKKIAYHLSLEALSLSNEDLHS